jgi:hypothetical protein
MHQGCVAGASEGGRGAAGWWPTSRNCRWGGRPTTPASWPPTTKRTCLATASLQAGGTALAPEVSGCRAKHRWPDSRPCSKAATRRRGSCSGVQTAATPCPPLTWSCGRPRASRSSTAWVTRPSDEPCCPPIMPGWLRRSATWTSTWAPAAAMAVSSTCPVRGCWRSASTTERPEKVTRCCTPIWWWPIGSRGRTAVGRRWTDGICTGIGWPRTPSTGRPTSASCLGRLGWSGRRPTPTATASSRGCPRTWSAGSPSAPIGSTPSWTGWPRMVGSGRRGWSSGRCTRPESRRSTKPRTPCLAAGGPRRPSADTTRTPWSAR